MHPLMIDCTGAPDVWVVQVEKRSNCISMRSAGASGGSLEACAATSRDVMKMVSVLRSIHKAKESCTYL